MKISLIHPSRSRPEKSVQTIDKWLNSAVSLYIELIVSVDEDDPSLELYKQAYLNDEVFIVNKNRSCVDAINNAAKVATGDILLVVSDDSSCFQDWDQALVNELRDKSDYLLKTDDGIQDYIVTMTIMDREYYKRDNHIYHPDMVHQFADTYLTCLADIRGRLIKSKLKFPHNHYSHLKETPDELHKRNDATWREGQNTFVRLMKQFTPEERARITNKSMQGFMRFAGI